MAQRPVPIATTATASRPVLVSRDDRARDSDPRDEHDPCGTLDYHCRCGQLQARVTVIASDRPRRSVCHCHDCQTFQHALGTAESVLDKHGGTEILMLSPAALDVVAGREHLAALRLSESGLLRWYASCCHTPLGNTPAVRHVPFLGLIAAVLSDINGAEALERRAGAVRERIFGAEARNGPPPGAHRKVPLRALPPMLAALTRRLVRGDHHCSPLFTTKGGPSVVPRVLTAAERAAFTPR